MSRPIEFRGFHPDENGKQTIVVDGKEVRGEWLFGDLVHFEGNVLICPNTDGKVGYIKCDVLPETVGEFTGLHDKNDKKIYEGDVLKQSGYWDFEIVWDYGFIVTSHDYVRKANNIPYIALHENTNFTCHEVIGTKWDKEGESRNGI
jgi:uncharacterized phage protein (TIGR01671 family)